MTILSGREGDQGRTRPLAESALLAAVTVLLMFAGAFMPLAGILIVLVMPIPVMVVVLRHGVRYATMTVVVTVFLSAMFLGLLQAVFAGVLMVGFIGLTFGIGLQRGWEASTLVGSGTVVIAALFVIIILAARPLMGVNLLERMEFMMTESIEHAGDMYTRLGLDPETTAEAVEQLNLAWEYMQMVFPAALMISALMYSIWTFLVVKLVLPRLGYSVPSLRPFARWRAPAWLAFLLIAAYASHLVLAMGWVVDVMRNVLFAAHMAYLVFGVSLLYYFIRRVISSRVISGLLCFVLTLNAVMALVLPLAAILDSGLDFRGRFEARAG